MYDYFELVKMYEKSKNEINKLKCKNYDLENENKQLKEELEEEKRINAEDLKTIDRQQERIDKAIKYIENFPNISYTSVEKVDGKILSGRLINKDEILEILKGDNNE